MLKRAFPWVSLMVLLAGSLACKALDKGKEKPTVVAVAASPEEAEANKWKKPPMAVAKHPGLKIPGGGSLVPGKSFVTVSYKYTGISRDALVILAERQLAKDSFPITKKKTKGAFIYRDVNQSGTNRIFMFQKKGGGVQLNITSI